MLNAIQAGQIGTIAGNGEPWFSGDGGPATLACLNEPKSVAFDSRGNLFIADSENHVIRRVDWQSGVITTVAGFFEEEVIKPSRSLQSEEPPASDGVDDPLADFVDSPASAYQQVHDLSGTVRYTVGKAPGSRRYSGDGGLAQQASLNFPSAIVVDPTGATYIADTWNHRIRRVDPANGRIETIAGTGQAKWTGDGGEAKSATLNEPNALVMDGKGRLYIADQSNNRVRMVDTVTGIMTTFAGNGESGYTGDGVLAVESGLAGVSGLAIDREGNVYLADTFNGRIRKVDAKTQNISTVVGDGQEFRYQEGVNEHSWSLSRPYGIACDPEGGLLITDSDNHLVRRWDADAKSMTLVAGNGTAQFSGDGSKAQESSLSFPFGVAVDGKGNIAIADTFNHRVRLIPAST